MRADLERTRFGLEGPREFKFRTLKLSIRIFAFAFQMHVMEVFDFNVLVGLALSCKLLGVESEKECELFDHKAV